MRLQNYLGLLLIVACSGGGDGPSGPDETLLVSGTWLETSQITSNPCDLPLPETRTSTVQIVQTGTQLTRTSAGITHTGSLNFSSHNFSFFVDDGIAVVYVQQGHFSSSSRYVANSDSFTDEAGVCTLRTSDTGTRQ